MPVVSVQLVIPSCSPTALFPLVLSGTLIHCPRSVVTTTSSSCPAKKKSNTSSLDVTIEIYTTCRPQESLPSLSPVKKPPATSLKPQIQPYMRLGTITNDQ